ncbi:h domain protein [Nocardia sp. CDC153]|uniref:h domain protein n=1 Tax=Nocardia sp. CDC153 TaxID=3112167 RepID=UPI002DBF7629|nr:h domain protein [Nocardia sp. CDC153]MEC3955351.1 h domain protein [Nocardia sp. CDC153]
MSSKTRRDLILMVCALVVFAASLGVGGWIGYGYWQDSHVDQARDQSVVVAKRTVEGMFGYNFRTIDTTMPKVCDDMTAKFRDDWMKVTKDVLSPAAKDKELVVEATATEAGVIKADSHHVEVMVYLNQKSAGKDPSKGTYDASRLRVKLDHSGDRWLVSDVNPI